MQREHGHRCIEARVRSFQVGQRHGLDMRRATRRIDRDDVPAAIGQVRGELTAARAHLEHACRRARKRALHETDQA
jgi:hypothetical protein